MFILAVLGSESHTTSRGWSNLSINGKKVTHRDAHTKEWLTNFGDKHASWCECSFAVKPGDIVVWEAGSNSGNRGANRERVNRKFVVNPDAKFDESPLPYPAKNVRLAGSLAPVEESNQNNHQSIKEKIPS